MMVKRGLGPEAKKEYVKPEVKRNEPLVDITFGTATGTATTGTGTLTGTGGPTGTLINTPKPGGGGLDLGTDGMGDYGIGEDYGNTATITGAGTVIPGTGGAPGTVL